MPNNTNWFNSRPRETGKRYKMVCTMPAGNEDRTLAILDDLRLEMCKRFGGWTEHASAGGWLFEGKLVKEESITFETSFINRVDIESAREMFTTAGLLLGNDWIHIECHTFDAMHTKAQG